jgi:predicted metal-dependent hydrolase
VELNGTDIGAVADSIANNPALASDIQRALVVYVRGLKDEKQAEKDKTTAAEALAAEALAKAARVIERAEATLAGGDSKELADEIAAAKLTKKQARRAEIAAEKARLEAEDLELAQ